MTKPTKHKVGLWLLISLIPAVILLGIGLVGGAASGYPEDGAWVAIVALSILYTPFAAVIGLVLLAWGNIEFNRAYRTAQQYAEMNGWHPISRTAWRNRKRNNVALSVGQAFQKPTYILRIEIDGETVTIDEFETSLWALQFGDWLWEELLQANATPDRVTVVEKRAEWEQSRAMAIYHPRGPARRGD